MILLALNSLNAYRLMCVGIAWCCSPHTRSERDGAQVVVEHDLSDAVHDDWFDRPEPAEEEAGA